MSKSAIAFWNAVKHARHFIGAWSISLLFAMGFGLLSGCVGAAISLFTSCVQFTELWGVEFTAETMKNVGAVAGCLIYIAVFCRKASAYERPLLVVLPFVELMIGVMILFLVSLLRCPDMLGFIGAFIFGLGSGVGVAVWLEAISLLSPRKIISTIALSYCVNPCVNGLCVSLIPTGASVCLFVLMAVSCGVLLCLYDKIASTEKVSFVQVHHRLSWRTSAWVFVFMFVHGVGTYFTMTGTAAASMHFGVFLSGLFVLLCMAFLGDRFDADSVYKVWLC